jgi:hypothetical protein
MERILVSVEELLSILNSELSSHEEFKNCRFETPPMKLLTPDEDGCNWSTIQIRYIGVSSEVGRPVVERIVAQARKRYNIKKICKET